MTSTKEVRPTLDPETCAVCGRRVLQGEQITWYAAADGSRRPVCELCVPRAERARWMRMREGEEPLQLAPARGQRASLMRRVANFFSSQEREDFEELEPRATRGDPDSRRQARATRRGEREQRDRDGDSVLEPQRLHEVQAIPVGAGSKLEQGVHLFNESQFTRTIGGLSRSLGAPQVAIVNDSDSSVEIYVGWDIAWYSYRVDLGDAVEPVEQSGRGNDTIELDGVVSDWNGFADDYGRLFLTGEAIAAERSTEETDTPGENPQS